MTTDTSRNGSLNKARKEKNDEFYTRLADIEQEIDCYGDFFAGKTVYCNCDDPKISQFFVFFVNNFHRLRLKKLIVSYYGDYAAEETFLPLFDEYVEKDLYALEINDVPVSTGTQGVADVELLMKSRLNHKKKICRDLWYPAGDFRSSQCVEYMQQADVLVTNPPFSLFRDYIKLARKYDKKFLLVGNMNGITYQDVFPYMKNNEMWLGVHHVKEFVLRDGSSQKFGNNVWYTNIPHGIERPFLELTEKYTPEKYPTYDNYGAIDVALLKEIPYDYDGIMGVPITFMEKFNKNQFDIIGLRAGTRINGKDTYKRIFIQRKGA